MPVMKVNYSIESIYHFVIQLAVTKKNQDSFQSQYDELIESREELMRYVGNLN